MRIVWDEPKRVRNLARRRLDFERLTPVFFENAAIYAGKKGRLVAVGELDGIIIVAVVFAVLGAEAVSVISMRPASRKERRML